MLFHKKVIVLLVAQSSALLASGFVAPTTPFGLSTTPKSFSNAGPLLVSAVEDEAAAETVVEDAEPPVTVADSEAVAEISASEKPRLTIFVGNLPFRTLTCVCVFPTFCLTLNDKYMCGNL
jgi:hypothetical protein